METKYDIRWGLLWKKVSLRVVCQVVAVLVVILALRLVFQVIGISAAEHATLEAIGVIGLLGIAFGVLFGLLVALWYRWRAAVVVEDDWISGMRPWKTRNRFLLKDVSYIKHVDDGFIEGLILNTHSYGCIFVLKETNSFANLMELVRSKSPNY